jgi:S1-C subfamily serine protease
MRRFVLGLLATVILLGAASSARADFVLGVTTRPATDWTFGLQVTAVSDPSAAKAIGIQVGNVIYNVNGKNLVTNQDLKDALASSGGNVTVSWLEVTSDGLIHTHGISFSLTDDGEEPSARKAGKMSRASKVSKVKAATAPTRKRR